MGIYKNVIFLSHKFFEKAIKKYYFLQCLYEIHRLFEHLYRKGT